MKKSTYLITIPYSDYEELIKIKNEYEQFKSDILSTIDFNEYKENNNLPIIITNKLFEIIKKILPFSSKNAQITFEN